MTALQLKSLQRILLSFVKSPVAALVVLVLVSCYPLWLELFARWSGADDPYSHGWLIGLLVLVQLAVKNAQLEYERVSPCLWLAVPLAGVALGAHLLNLISIQLAQAIALPCVLVLALWTVLGWRATRTLLFPVGFLVFALPLWQPLVGVLQTITTTVAGALLGLAGISLAIDGNIITIPAGSFAVADGCSGLKYFLTSASLASLYAYWFVKGLRRQLLLIAAGIFLAMLTNWIRVAVIVMAGHLTDMQHPLVKEHDNFGWILYAVSLLPFYWFAYRLSAPPEADAAGNNTTAQTQAVTPLTRRALLLTATVLLGALGLASALKYASHPAIPVWETAAPASTAAPLFPWQPAIHGSHHARVTRHIAPGLATPVTFVRHEFGAPWQDEIRDYRDDYFPAPWHLVDTRITRIQPLGEIAMATIARSSRRHQLVMYWFTVGEQNTVSLKTAKLLQALHLLEGKFGASLTFIATECASDCTAEEKYLREFAGALQLRRTGNTVN